MKAFTAKYAIFNKHDIAIGLSELETPNVPPGPPQRRHSEVVITYSSCA